MSEVLSFNKSDIWAERLRGEREIAMRLAQGGAFQSEGTTRGKALMYTLTRRFWKWCGGLGNWIRWKEMSRRGMEAFFSLCCDFFTLSEMETLEVFEQKRELTWQNEYDDSVFAGTQFQIIYIWGPTLKKKSS